MDGAKKSIYPMHARQNYNPILYADIAIRNYVRSNELFLQMDFGPKGSEEHLIFDLFIEFSISSIVFSTMCIEAFLNDYAAACLGDTEFYGPFDKLSIEGKFALIGKFILNAEIDKGAAYYTRLKKLVTERNRYTHSKSTELRGYATIEEATAGRDYFYEHIEDYAIDKAPYKELLRSSKNGICAIRDIAAYFDKYDGSVDAVHRLFCLGNDIPNSQHIDVRGDVLREFQIKLR